MNTFTVALLNLENNIAFNELDKLNKKESDAFSDKSFDEETIPDEDLNRSKKLRCKLMSCPNPNVEREGPNINLKINYKRYSNQKEKEFFYEKIKQKRKTELCKNYELYHDCYFKDECSFAHGIEELRENIIFPSYKTKLCKSFHENKVCNFGIRCTYNHNIL
jgi:hypothetical protein